MADENFYSASVRELLTASSEQSYASLLQQCLQKWSPAFVQHYSSNLESDVTASAVCATEHLNIVPMAYVGITNNVSESFNRVLKDFQSWKVKSAVLHCVTVPKSCITTCSTLSRVYWGQMESPE